VLWTLYTYVGLIYSNTMSGSPFKSRKARKVTHSDNPKTARNRTAESSKKGFDAAELKAKNGHRVAKHRQLTRLHNSREWQRLSSAEQTKRESDVIAVLEQKLHDKIKELEREWDRQVDESDIEDKDESDALSADQLGNDMDLDPVVTPKGDAEEDWDDEPEDPMFLLGPIHQKHARVWKKRLSKWERMAQKEAKDRN